MRCQYLDITADWLIEALKRSNDEHHFGMQGPGLPDDATVHSWVPSPDAPRLIRIYVQSAEFADVTTLAQAKALPAVSHVRVGAGKDAKTVKLAGPLV